MTEEKDCKKPNATQMGIHSVRNFLGHPTQLTLFSDQHRQFSDAYGVELEGQIERFGFDLTDIQMRVMEGILRGFTETNYKGNIAPEDKEKIAQQRYSGKLPDTYKYVREIPRLRVTQKQLIEWAGLSLGSAGDKQRAIEALALLGTKQYCCHYDRLALNQNDEPEKDKNGNWKKEAVYAVDTLFTIKAIREEISEKQKNKSTKMEGEVKYYEVTPSAIFLDQRESYFILIPYNWRDEIYALYKGKKISAYIPKFIYFLRLQYEVKRRSRKEKSPFQTRWTPEEIAIALRMPKSVYKGQRERMNKLLEEAYSVAKTLGYLSKFERTDTVDILTFHDFKFTSTNPPNLEKAIGAMSITNSPSVTYLFDLFHKKKQEHNEYHTIPEGKDKEEQLKEFNSLLNEKKPEDVEEIIKWGLGLKYWCDRLSTPRKLRENFSTAWVEMNATKKQGKQPHLPEDNKKLAQEIAKLVNIHRPDIEIDPSGTFMEIRSKSSAHVLIIEYGAKDFKLKIEAFLQKINIPASTIEAFLT